MGRLLKKEMILSLHPTSLIFLLLSTMLLIPNYPYYVVFFYTGLSVFFTCLSGRENHDIMYTLSLPVSKRDVVGARFLSVVLLQLVQMLTAVPFAALRQAFPLPGNQAGMDAGISLFGLSFVMLGLFNLVFFTCYYKDVKKVGSAFLRSCITVFLYIGLAETCAFTVPFVRDRLDTPDTQDVGIKLIVLLIGALLYTGLTLISYRKSVRSFEKQDL